MNQTRRLEWPTLAMLAACYAAWVLGLAIWPSHPIIALLLTGIAIAQHGSLQHEVLHGHPFRTQWLNEALVFAPLGLFTSYIRFKDTHLQHHYDPDLTDPYDDPESNYMDPAVWAQLSAPMKALCRINNTLAGRMVLGPLLGTISFLWEDFKRLAQGDARIWLAYTLHLIGVILVFGVLSLTAMPVWAYLIAAYLGLSLLKVRSFLEHRAHDLSRARTAIVEDRGPLSYLFLNNNFHVVHHCMPALPWYELPRIYAAKAEEFRNRTDNYVYRSYATIFRQYLFRAKDPVPHPIWTPTKTKAASQPAKRRHVA